MSKEYYVYKKLIILIKYNNETDQSDPNIFKLAKSQQFILTLTLDL